MAEKHGRARSTRTSNAGVRTKRTASTTTADNEAALDMDQLFQDVEQQPAQLSDERLEEIDSDFALGHSASQYRRAALGMLTRSGKQLIEWAETSDQDAAEALADAIAGVEAAARRYRAMADIMEGSAARGMVAICVRANALELLATARKEHAEDVAEGTSNEN